jgi:nucleoid-associated protein YgaU
MNKLVIQRLTPRKETVGSPLEVQFNPTQYGFSKSAQFAEQAIPGLDNPVLQFVRGESETLTLELFFDTTDDGTGAGATSVNTKVDPLYRLIKVDGQQHAPPICRVAWGEHFPGSSPAHGDVPRSFEGVVTSCDRRYTLFSSEGIPLRALVTLSLREYKTLQEQLDQLNLQSADHTRVHIVSQGDTLTRIANDYYHDPAQWRFIAEANAIRNARRLSPGTVLILPPRS